MDSSETLAGKRERAPVEGVMDSDTPTQSTDKESRLGDLRLASVMDKEVVKGRALRWQPGMKEGIDTQIRRGAGASVFVDGGGPVLSAWVAEEWNRILGQELTECGERA